MQDIIDTIFGFRLPGQNFPDLDQVSPQTRTFVDCYSKCILPWDIFFSPNQQHQSTEGTHNITADWQTLTKMSKREMRTKSGKIPKTRKLTKNMSTFSFYLEISK